MKQKLYDAAPILIQNLFTTIYGYKLKKERYGKYYKAKMKQLKKFDQKTNDELINLQLKNLKKFIKYSKKNSPYYSEKLKGFKVKKVEDLKEAPILSKEDIRENINAVKTIKGRKYTKADTGGTTGKSLTVFYTIKDFQYRMAYLDYFKETHGVKKGMKRASFTGKNLVPPKQTKKNYWRYNGSLNQLLFSSFHANEENMSLYINKLNEFKPQSLDGFPSVMLKIAKYALRNSIEFEFKPKAIFPTAESLSNWDKDILEKAFRCKVRNQYASSEGAPFITECTHGSLHLNISSGVFEKVENKDISEIYVTSFTTHGTPLIRYKIGDSLEFTEQKCICENNTPIVKRILGRSMDFLYSQERGTISSVNMANAVKNLPNSIISIQFIQKQVEKIVINIVPDKQTYKKKHTQQIEQEMVSRFGDRIMFEFNFLNELPKENSGKTRFIINKLNPESLKN